MDLDLLYIKHRPKFITIVINISVAAPNDHQISKTNNNLSKLTTLDYSINGPVTFRLIHSQNSLISNQ